MSLRIAFRVDAGPEIGIGHVIRCLPLADAVTSRGGTALFLARRMPRFVFDVVTQRGHAVHLLSSHSGDPVRRELEHSRWLGTTQAVDAQDSVEALHGGQWDWMVVDHYALGQLWESQLRSVVPHMLVIDDLADRRHDCDVLLDQNLFPDMHRRYLGRVSDHSALLLGPRFSLLRHEFARMRERTGIRDGRLRRVLVLLGGSDQSNCSARAVRALMTFGKTLHVDIVLGGGHPAIDEIGALCGAAGYELHVQSSAVAELMARADLAIGAAGSTSWERCCLGLPAICVTLAKNQEPIAAGLAACGAVVNLGDAAAVTDEQLTEAVTQLDSDPQRLRALSAASRELVDGLGVDRTLRKLEVIS